MLKGFSRISKLFEVFAQDSAGPRLQPGLLDDVVYLVHPAAGPASRIQEADCFQIAGGAGVTTLGDSVSLNRVKYYFAVHVTHNGAAARDVFIGVVNKNATFTCFYHAAVAAPAGTPIVVSRPMVIPPGNQLLVSAPGLLAGESLVLTGFVHVLPIDEQPSPLF